MSKLCQETHLTWKQILPLPLLRIRRSPTKQTGFSPCEILYGRPPPLVEGIKRDLKSRKSNLAPTDAQFGRSANVLHRHVPEKLPISLTTDMHSFKPGDQVWIKERNLQPLQPCCRGPYSVTLTTPTAIKVAKITPWIHHTRVKKAAPEYSQLNSNNRLKLPLKRGPSALL
jgi:hypothetical protein